MKKSKVIFLVVLACAFGASADIVSRTDAAMAARRWTASGSRFGARTGGLVDRVVEYQDSNLMPVFYAVEFAHGGGTVFTSADTTKEPILAFTTDSVANLDENSPLAVLLRKHTSHQQSSAANQKKWGRILSKNRLDDLLNPYLTSTLIPIDDVGGIEDLRVQPLLKTKWSQAETYNAKGKAMKCYNYYTPAEVVAYHYSFGLDTTNIESTVCGCVATAMAQLMRYWSYPTDERESFSENCNWPTNSVLTQDKTGDWSVSETTLSGKLSTQAGAYDWENMMEVPMGQATEEACQAIGKLTYDCGVSVGMHYGISKTGGSGILTTDADLISKALKNHFSYTNAILSMSTTSLSKQGVSEIRRQAILANLDAGRPVIILISGSDGGHAVVGDGYGFSTAYEDAEDAYVHLNMGWAGQNDVWYNLPLIDTNDNPEDFAGFDTIESVVFNVAPSNNLEVISGQILRDGDEIVTGLRVTATDENETIYETTTSETGVYAFEVPGGHTYVVKAEEGRRFGETDPIDLSVSTGSRPANSWGNDFSIQYPSVKVGTTEYTSLDRALMNVQDGAKVEILLETRLRRSVELLANCTIVSTNLVATNTMIACSAGAVITIPAGVTAAVSCVAFETDGTTFAVQDGGVLKAGGYCQLGRVETEAYTNLVVTSVLEYPFEVSCAQAPNEENAFAVADAGMSLEDSQACAFRLLHANNVRLGGAAESSGSDIVFFWSADAKVPKEAAAVQTVIGGETVYFRRLDCAFDALPHSSEVVDLIVTKSSAFPWRGALACSVMLHSADDSQFVLEPSDTTGITLTNGISLVVSNLVFRGYEDSDQTDSKGFLSVEGGSLALGEGAELREMVGNVSNGSGVIDLTEGTVTLEAGSLISDCSAKGGKNGIGYGGAIYASYSTNCTVNLFGGQITNCFASSYGGAVYADAWNEATPNVFIKGDVTIVGNSSGNQVNDNICLQNIRAMEHFYLVGELDGLVGVNYSTEIYGFDETGNNKGNAFIMNDLGEAVTNSNSAACLINDIDGSLSGYWTSERPNVLIWADEPQVDSRICPPEDKDLAAARLITPDGTNIYYYTVADALNVATNGCTVEVMANANLSANVVIHGAVTLRAAPYEETYPPYLMRYNDISICVDTGASLVVTNLDFYTNGESTRPYFDVAGGYVTLTDIGIWNIEGKKARNANAVTVWNDGVLVMDGWATIDSCSNGYQGEGDASVESGVGGGLLVDHATVYLKNSWITSSSATQGGGVFACNNSKVYVSDQACVCWNTDCEWGLDNNMVISDDSELIVAGELTGVLGLSYGLYLTSDAKTNIAAVVSKEWSWDEVSLTNSAAGFYHDETGAMALAVTNITDATDALLIWPSAVSDTGFYTNSDKRVYYWVVALESSSFTPLPQLSLTAGADDVLASLQDSALSDPAVAQLILGASNCAQAYDDFRNWALSVPGGVAAVCASSQAAVSYAFGAKDLFTETPTVEISDLVQNGDNNLSVKAVVKDAGDSTEVLPERMAEMFEATSNLLDWSQKVELTVEAGEVESDNSIRFTVRPAQAAETIFIRVRY